MKMYLLAIGVILLCLLHSGISRAQLTQDEIMAFPTTPPAGKTWSYTKTFMYTGDSFYAQTPKPFPTVNINPREFQIGDFDFYQYLGTKGKRFTLMITYGGPAAFDAGSCQHTHLQYGVKGSVAVRLFGITYRFWTWLGGGTMSGDWDPVAHTCTRRVNNQLAAHLGSIYGWGQDSVNVASTGYDSIVAIVMAPTHGFGNCQPNPAPGVGTFLKCLEPVNVYSYTY